MSVVVEVTAEEAAKPARSLTESEEWSFSDSKRDLNHGFVNSPSGHLGHDRAARTSSSLVSIRRQLEPPSDPPRSRSSGPPSFAWTAGTQNTSGCH